MQWENSNKWSQFPDLVYNQRKAIEGLIVRLMLFSGINHLIVSGSLQCTHGTVN